MDTFKTRGSVLLCLRSRDLSNTPANGFNSSGRFYLQDAIEAEPNEVMSIKLLSAIIPNSWDNLSSSLSNNTLMITEKRISDNAELSYTITIPNGSYSINELNDELTTLLDASSASDGYSLNYTFSYSEINNLDTITSSDFTAYNTTFKFSQGNSCRRFIGFTAEDKTINSASGITSDRSVDITDTYNSLYVRLPNLTSQKVVESFTNQYSNIIAQIPITFSRNCFISFEPSNPFEMELKNTAISSLFCLITYQNERQEVDFQNNDWEINLEINFYRAGAGRARNIKREKQHYNKPLTMPNVFYKYNEFLRKYKLEQDRIRELGKILRNKTF